METTVPTTTAEPRVRRHPLVIATERELMSMKPGEYGLAYGRSAKSLDVSVGRENMRRALHIMDALIKRIEKAGGKVTIGKEHPWKTMLSLEGVSLQVKMTERSNRADHVLTAQEQKEKEKGRYWRAPKYDFTPNGDLVFEIVDYCGESQRHWTDGNRRKFSTHPDRLFEAFKKAVEAWKVQEARREEEHRRYLEEQERREEARRKQEEENRRIENVKALAQNWETADRIRRFVAAARIGLLKHHGSIEPGSPLDQWFERNERIADRLDPIPEAFSKLSSRPLPTN